MVSSCSPSKNNDNSKVKEEHRLIEIKDLENPKEKSQIELVELFSANALIKEKINKPPFTYTYQRIKDLKFSVAKDIQFQNFLNENIKDNDEINVEESEAFEFLNGKLPKTFCERSFYKGLSTTTYDLFTLPGKIVKKTGVNKYKILTPVQLIISNTLIENDYIESGLLFKDYLAKEMSANSSYVIGSFEAQKDQIVEITLTDVLKSFPKPESLDIERLKMYQEQIIDKTDS